MLPVQRLLMDVLRTKLKIVCAGLLSVKEGEREGDHSLRFLSSVQIQLSMMAASVTALEAWYMLVASASSKQSLVQTLSSIFVTFMSLAIAKVSCSSNQLINWLVDSI